MPPNFIAKVALPRDVKPRLRRRPPPPGVPPRRAPLVDEPFSRDGWLFEPKWDGERCLVVRRGGELHLYSRNRKRIDEQYPEVVASCARQKVRTYIADGELVAFKDGVTSFAV